MRCPAMLLSFSNPAMLLGFGVSYTANTELKHICDVMNEPTLPKDAHIQSDFNKNAKNISISSGLSDYP